MREIPYFDGRTGAGVVPHLGEGAADPAGEGGDEPVHLAVQAQVLDHLAAVRLQRAAVVVQVDAGDLADQRVGEHRRQAPVDKRVLPVLAPAADHVESRPPPR